MGFERLTSDLFKSKEYSRNELDLFTVDFMKRLKAKPLAIISKAESDVLENSYKNFKEGLGKLATEGAQQKGGTLNRQDAFDDVLDFVRRQEGLVKSKFGKQSPAYLEFYPKGLSEYSAAKVEGLTNLLVRYVAAANKYQKDLGKDLMWSFGNIISELGCMPKNCSNNIPFIFRSFATFSLLYSGTITSDNGSKTFTPIFKILFLNIFKKIS